MLGQPVPRALPTHQDRTPICTGLGHSGTIPPSCCHGHPEGSGHSLWHKGASQPPQEPLAWLWGRAAKAYLEAGPPGHLQPSRIPLSPVTEGSPLSPPQSSGRPPLSPALCPSPRLVCSHETSKSHNSQHQLHLPAVAVHSHLASLSGARRRRHTQEPQQPQLGLNQSTATPGRAPSPISQSKAVKKNKKPQVNPSKTSGIKSWQRTVLLCLPHFLPSPGMLPTSPQTEQPFTAAPNRGRKLCATLTALQNPCCPSSSDPPSPASTAAAVPGPPGPWLGSYTLCQQ